MDVDPAVQAAQTYLHNVFCGTPSCALDCLEDARSVVAAVTPLIRAQAFTEAADAIEAQRKEGQEWNHPDEGGVQFESFRAGWVRAMERSAALVRGLGEETASVDSKINTT